MIRVHPFNESHVKLGIADYSIEAELHEFFSMFVTGYKFMPAYRSGQWDGKLRLFNMRNKAIYKGLVPILEKFAQMRGYEIEVHPSISWSIDIDRETVHKFMLSLNLHGKGAPIELRDYQIDAVHHTLSNKRCILVSATSSGKSAMIYSMIRYHLDAGRRILLIVPNINLVKQMHSDFVDYSTANGWNVAENVHSLYAGKDRVFDKGVIISTWQTLSSMIKKDADTFKTLTDNVDVVIGDEAHLHKSAETTKIIESFTQSPWRIGTTGTLDGTQLSELQLTGLFGPTHQIITARELIDAGQATEVEVRIILLQHPEVYRKALKGMDYIEETNQIVANAARTDFIVRLALSCVGPTLILQNLVVRHGDIIHSRLKALAKPGRQIYYIHGGVDADEREKIRQIVDTEDDAIIVATASLMSTGTNLPSLANIIFAAPSKSNIRIRQSIGRGLRLKDGKSLTKIFDIADDYRYKSFTNITYRHLEARIAIYLAESFPYTITHAPLKY